MKLCPKFDDKNLTGQNLSQIDVAMLPESDRTLIWLPTENFSLTGIDIFLTRDSML
jgi:hypothetical protein